ncbi:MAG: YggS family pyridoxal phosphate enzyme [Acidimicrobiales bacterium]
MSGTAPPTEPSALLERASILQPEVTERLSEIRRRIERAGGDPGTVRIVGVTKTFGPESALAGVLAGLTELGENYADELIRKAAALSGLVARQPSWHFIGAIQRNKIARLAGVVACWQSVSRAIEAEAIALRTTEPRPSIFVEVNVAFDPDRPGCEPTAVPGLVTSIASTGLVVSGLMAVAPVGGDPETTDRAFAEVARLRRELGIPELSIGMSGDLEAAVRAGTTMVRIGTALFGPRNQRVPA